MSRSDIKEEIEKIEYDPESLTNLQKESEDCLRRKEYLEAYAILCRIEELFEPTAKLYLNRGICLYRLGEIKEAFESLEQSLQIDESNGYAIKLKEMIEQKLDRLAKYWGVQMYA